MAFVREDSELPEKRLQKLRQRFVNVKWIEGLRQLFPVTQWLFNYKVADLPYDVIAGFTVGMTLVPQCLSYAALANVRSEFGLYTSFFGQFIYCLMGTSKDGSVGPTSITAMMLGMVNAMYNPLVDEGDNTYNALVVFISGVILVAIGVFRLGFIVSLFSIPVVSGFTSAAGFFIIGSQMKLFFGLKWAPNDSPSTFIKQMKNIYDRRDEIKVYDVTCGCVCMATLFMFQYTPVVIARIRQAYKKGKSKADSPIVARLLEVVNLIAASRNAIVFVICTGVSYYFYSQAADSKAFEKKLSLVGFIKPGLPPFQFPATQIIANRTVLISANEANTLPNSSLIVNASGIYARKLVVLKTTSQIFGDLSAMIIIIPLMTLLENFSITKALGRKNGYTPNPTNELLSVGLSNIFTACVNGFTATTTISRCALNDQCKVKTQLASVISAVIIIVTLVALTPLFYFIPKPCLAAIMVCAGINLVDYNIAIHMWHEYPRDVFVLAFSFLLCLLYDIAYGVLIILLLHMASFLRPIIAVRLRVSRRPIEPAAYDEITGKRLHLTVIRIPHGMEYPSCDQFVEAITKVFQTTEDKNILIDCAFIETIDYSGIQAVRAVVMLAFKLNKHAIFTNLDLDIHERLRSIGVEHFSCVATLDEAVQGHNWASQASLDGHEVVGDNLVHIASIVAPNIRIQSSLEANKEGDDAQTSVPNLSEPLTAKYLGTAWQPGGQLMSASLGSMFAVASIGHLDDKDVDKWQQNAMARQMSARTSMSKLNSAAVIKEETENVDYESKDRRPSGIYITDHHLLPSRKLSDVERKTVRFPSFLAVTDKSSMVGRSNSTSTRVDSIREHAEEDEEMQQNEAAINNSNDSPASELPFAEEIKDTHA